MPLQEYIDDKVHSIMKEVAKYSLTFNQTKYPPDEHDRAREKLEIFLENMLEDVKYGEDPEDYTKKKIIVPFPISDANQKYLDEMI